MRRGIKRAADLFLWLYSAVGIIFLSLVIITTFLQVTTRYFMEASLPWTEEGARYAFIWMSMMGASLATRHASHATIDLIGDFIHGEAGRYHAIFVQSAVILAAALVGFYGLRMIGVMMVRSSAALGIPMGVVYCAIPIGCVGIIIQCLANLAELPQRRPLQPEKTDLDPKREVVSKEKIDVDRRGDV